MNLVELQDKLLGLASLIYLLATASYIIYLGRRSDVVGKAATILGFTGVALHTLGLVFRWWAAGIDHPPFTNLYESLVFFGWGIVVFYLYMEWRYEVKMAGAFVFPVALAAMGIAVMHQEKGIMPLPDALKSWWLHIHVMFASIAYAAFVVAFAFSLMYLIKDKIRREVFGVFTTTFSALALLAILLRNGMSNFGIFAMKQTVLHEGKIMPVRISDTDFAWQPIPTVEPLFAAALIVLALAAVLYLVRIYKESNALDKASSGALGVSVALLTIGLFEIFDQTLRMNNVSITAEPFLIVLLFLIWIVAGGMLMLHIFNESITERLPDVDRLDFLSYRSVIVAFPLMTIVIVTGAVWAQSAWGRYWSWDPKETASLVTWFVYAIYLHSRRRRMERPPHRDHFDHRIPERHLYLSRRQHIPQRPAQLRIVDVRMQEPRLLCFLTRTSCYNKLFNMKLAPRIIIDESIRFGKPVIEGTRVPVELVLEKLANGCSEKELAEEYQITEDDIRAVLHYAASVISEEQLKALSR